MSEPQPTTVRLLSWTMYPIQTIYCEWLASRNNDPVPDPSDVNPDDPAVLEVFRKVVEMKIPVSETVDFVFLLEHVPVALREQLVRHRVGHSFGGRYGADVVPDLDRSTFWTQTMRVMKMDTFADDGEYLLPESVRGNTGPCGGKNKTVEEFYREQFLWIQSAYRKLLAAGVPVEDARNILPLGACHRMTWKVNLSSLLHVLGKRSCWIAQLGMWEPVIRGVVDELANRVHPEFRRLIDPPCFEGGKWVGCKFGLENDNRVAGADPYAPCPLYLGKHEERARTVSLTVEGAPWKPHWSGLGWVHTDVDTQEAAADRSTAYSKLWGRDPRTGELL